MRRVIHPPAPVKSPATNFPEKLRVVRAAHVEPRGVHLRAAAFVSDSRGCWRPGMKFEDARPVNAVEALRRHAEVAVAAGIYAPERRKAAA